MTEPEIPDKALRDALRAYALEEVTVGWEGLDEVQRGEIGAKVFVALQRVLDKVGKVPYDSPQSLLAADIRFEIERALR